MTKAKYMALEDFQTLWTNRIKPALPSIVGEVAVTYASDQTCQDAVAELT